MKKHRRDVHAELAGDRIIGREDRYRQIFEQAADAIFVIGSDTSFIDVNESACASLGYTRDELLSMKIGEVDGKYSEEELVEVMSSLREGLTLTIETTHCRKDGSCFPVEVSSRSLGLDGEEQVFSIVRDISERKHAEAALRASEERFRTIFESIDAGLLLTEPMSQRHVMANRAACKMFGYTERQMTRLSVADTHPPDELPYVLAQFERGARGEVQFAPDIPALRSDGSRFYVDISAGFVSISGRPHLLGVFRDVSERKQTEDALSWEWRVNAGLAKLSKTLVGGTQGVEEIAKVVLDRCLALTESEHGSVSSIDAETGEKVGHTLTQRMDVRALQSDGLFGGALNDGVAFYTNAPEKPLASLSVEEGHIELRRFLTVPAKIEGRVVGQIALANSKRDYKERDLEAVQRFADLYALALQRYQAQVELTAHRAQLEKMVSERSGL